MNYIRKRAYTIVDIETTGLSPYSSAITEIACLKMRNDRIIRRYSTLVNPQRPIPKFITRLTGINDSMVRNAPKISRVMPEFIGFLEDSPFVGHNAWFDYSFLELNAKKARQKKMENDVICTVRLARQLVPELPRKNLASLCEYFKIKNINAHRAMGDALATSQIFSKMMDILEKKGLSTYDELFQSQFKNLAAHKASDA